jgi:hypothetical protein
VAFGVKKFHQYLYGHKFTLITDHKPLSDILSPKIGIPSLAAARLQRWAVLLSAYNYQFRFKPTSQHCNADGLPLTTTEPSMGGEGFNIGEVQALSVTFQDVQKATRHDSILGKIIRHMMGGWPAEVSEVLKPYENREPELTVESNRELVLLFPRTSNTKSFNPSI